MNENPNRRILVIDDNKAIHDDFRKILSLKTDDKDYGDITADLFDEGAQTCLFAGFEIDSAFQGREGLEKMKESLAAGKPYSVAFIDVRMPPGWDGIETTSRLWEICPELQVVICTAYSDYDWSGIATKLGQTDRLLILKKPFDSVEVLQMAETLAQKWMLARQSALRVADLDAMVHQRTQELRASNEQLAQEVTDRCEAQAVLSAFSTLGSRLSAAQTMRDAGQIILDTADRLFGYDACLLDRYVAETDTLTRIFHADVIEGQRKECVVDYENPSPSPLVRKTILEGGQLLLADLSQPSPPSYPFGDKQRRSAAILFVPIRNGMTVIGLLSIQSYRANAYNARSLETLQALADHCGGAVDRILIEEALHNAQDQLRQSQKLEAIGQLAGGIAHDFNNLLTVVSGNAELGRMQDGVAGVTKECFDQITIASDRAANLTRQLLAFSRKQMMQSHPVSLEAVITDLGKMLKRLIGENIDLRCQFVPNLPLVHADTGMLEQMLVNLVVNARDAMPDGGKLVITAGRTAFDAGHDPSHPEARPGQFVVVTVRDTGEGISQGNMPHIFEPFFTTKGVGKGTGLGLATVYGIVKQHQGWVEVSSKVGAGSLFGIYLPALPSDARPPAQPPPESGESPKGNESILLVEDEQPVRAITRLLLLRAGYRVFEAASGAEALKVWETEASKVDLLLTDIIMPDGINGRNLAETLRQKSPSLKIIFQSGYGGDILNGSSDFLRETNGYFLQKPCGARDLLCAVRHCLDGKPAKREQSPSQD